MPTPNYGQMYRMADPMSEGIARAALPERSEMSLTSAVAHLRGESDDDVNLQLMPGGRMTDVLWTTFAPIILISNKVLQVIHQQQLSGVGRYRVILPEGQEEYSGFAVTGRAGKRDFSRAQVVTLPAPVTGGEEYQALRGIYFEKDNWDGSDFSLVEGSLFVVVTRKVKQAFDKAKIRGVQFLPLLKEEIPLSIYQIQGLWTRQ